MFVLDSLGGFQIFALGPAQIFQGSRESLSCHVIYCTVLFSSVHCHEDDRLLESPMGQAKGVSGGTKPFKFEVGFFLVVWFLVFFFLKTLLSL